MLDLNLSVCPSLQKIELALRLTYSDVAVCREACDIVAALFKKFPISRVTNPVFSSVTFTIEFTSPGGGVVVSQFWNSTLEANPLELRDNALDDVLVELVQRMALTRITVKYQTSQMATREGAEEAVKNMFSKLEEKGYLQLICIN